MTRINTSTSYIRTSRTIAYSMFLVLPALILYGGMRIILFRNKDYTLDNSAYVIFRKWFSFSSGLGEWILTGFLVLGLLWLAVLHRQRIALVLSEGVEFSILTVMLLESSFWATVMLLIAAAGSSLFMALTVSPNFLEMTYLSIGAGLFEEFLFRLVLITAATVLFAKLLGSQKMVSAGFAIAISSLVFAGFHYLGPNGELFEYRTFALRLLLGTILGILFVTRGLGIAVYTHIFYDVALIKLTMTT